MTCAACVHHVGEAIRTVPGVANVSINLATARATVSLDSVAVADPPLDELARAVADAGYRLDTDATNSEADTGRSDEERDLLRRMLVAMAGSILLLLGGFPAFPWTDGLFAGGGMVVSAAAVGGGDAGATVGGLALLRGRFRRAATDAAQHAHPDRAGHIGGLRVQCGGGCDDVDSRFRGNDGSRGGGPSSAFRHGGHHCGPDPAGSVAGSAGVVAGVGRHRQVDGPAPAGGAPVVGRREHPRRCGGSGCRWRYAGGAAGRADSRWTARSSAAAPRWTNRR